MKHLSDAVRQAVQQENWYAALSLALTLPDIASKLEYPDIRGAGRRYTSWVEQNISPRYPRRMEDGATGTWISGADLYALRCAVLHEGSFDTTDHMKKAIDRAFDQFQFTDPLPNGNSVHGNSIFGRLQLEVHLFAIDVADAIDEWSAGLQSADVLARMQGLMRITTFLQPDGSIRI